jgi:hypothetical protein
MHLTPHFTVLTPVYAMKTHKGSTGIAALIFNTIILSVVLYGCETWSLTLREERGLRVFGKRVLRIFGVKRDEVTGEWRKLHNEALNDPQCSPISVRVIKSRMRWGEHVAHMEKRVVYRVFMGKPEE